MRELNIEFQEKYKRCDKFIRDAYQSTSGVSEYIAKMKSEFQQGKRKVKDWEEDYEELRHLRKIRNDLAHDTSIDEDVCTEYDYEWICYFYDRLMTVDDPLSRLHNLQNNNKNKKIKNNQKNKVKKSSEKESSKDIDIILILIVIALVFIVLLQFKLL